jgi:hypothetical protein
MRAQVGPVTTLVLLLSIGARWRQRYHKCNYYSRLVMGQRRLQVVSGAD